LLTSILRAGFQIMQKKGAYNPVWSNGANVELRLGF
jgi:hypothetical protein